MTERPAGRIQSVARAAGVLKQIANSYPHGVRLSEVAAELGVARSSAHAMLRTLEDYGLVAEIEGSRFVLGTYLITLGDIATQQVPLAGRARPLLTALCAETRLSTRLAISDDGFPVFVARVDGPGAVRFFTPLGHREAPNASAAGKVILAGLSNEKVRDLLRGKELPRRTDRTITDVEVLIRDLEEVRKRGYGVDNEEDTEGIFCVAAGVRDTTGRVIGAISATGVKSERHANSVNQIGKAVQRAAQELTTLISPK